MARASFAGGDTASGALWKAKGIEALEAIENEDDRMPIEADLLTLPG
jgi:hypothetical protein